jgi:hypothetical protein
MTDKTFNCTDLEGNEISITYKTVLSAYDQERIDEVYMNNLVYNPETKKAEVNWSMGSLPIKRQDAIIANVVRSWTRPETLTSESIKRALTRDTFARLFEELEAVVAQGEIDEAKKKSSPEN